MYVTLGNSKTRCRILMIDDHPILCELRGVQRVSEFWHTEEVLTTNCIEEMHNFAGKRRLAVDVIITYRLICELLTPLAQSLGMKSIRHLGEKYDEYSPLVCLKCETVLPNVIVSKDFEATCALCRESTTTVKRLTDVWNQIESMTL